MSVVKVNQDSFQQEVLGTKGIVFVDFFAEWCGPCKLTDPIIHDMAEDEKYNDKVKFVQIDVDENQNLAAQFNVFSIPTFMVFKDGQPVEQFAGARDRHGFEAEIDKHV